MLPKNCVCRGSENCWGRLGDKTPVCTTSKGRKKGWSSCYSIKRKTPIDQGESPTTSQKGSSTRRAHHGYSLEKKGKKKDGGEIRYFQEEEKV